MSTPLASALVSAAAQLSPAEQAYLDEARQMQALSFVVHTPLVCFGLALPSLVLFVEWLGLRTGDPLYPVCNRLRNSRRRPRASVGTEVGRSCRTRMTGRPTWSSRSSLWSLTMPHRCFPALKLC